MSLKGIFRYRSKRNPGKLDNAFCYTYLTKDQPPSVSTIGGGGHTRILSPWKDSVPVEVSKTTLSGDRTT